MTESQRFTSRLVALYKAPMMAYKPEMKTAAMMKAATRSGIGIVSLSLRRLEERSRALTYQE